VNGIDPQIHNGTPKGVMSGLRNTFSEVGHVTTVPEMLASFEAVKARLPDLRRNSGSKSLFEAAVFHALICCNGRIREARRWHASQVIRT